MSHIGVEGGKRKDAASSALRMERGVEYFERET
jgi:hypothetical protein